MIPCYVVGFADVGVGSCFLVGCWYLGVVGWRNDVCLILNLCLISVCFRCRVVCFLLCVVMLVDVEMDCFGGSWVNWVSCFVVCR